MPATPEDRAAWNRRRAAAAKYRPNRVRLLLVIPAPPADPERDFYFESPESIEPVFENVVRVLFEEESLAADKPTYLKQLKRRGVFVAELKPTGPWEAGDRAAEYAPWLVLGVEPLEPERVVALDPLVLDAIGPAFERAKLPLLDARIPDAAKKPEDFRRTLRAALVKADLESLIRPLPGAGGARATRKSRKAAEAPEGAKATATRTASPRPERDVESEESSASRGAKKSRQSAEAPEDAQPVPISKKSRQEAEVPKPSRPAPSAPPPRSKARGGRAARSTPRESPPAKSRGRRSG